MSYTGPNYELVEKTVTLTRMKLAQYYSLGEDFIQSIDAEAAADYLSDQFAIRMRASVLGEQLPSYTATDAATAWLYYPDTWWDHFKHQYRDKWFMKWFVYRFPAKMKQRTSTVKLEVTWKNHAAYPWSNYITPLDDRFGRPVQITYLETRRIGGEQVDR